MDESRSAVRLARLKQTRTMSDYPDDYLTCVLGDASQAFEDYCGRPDLGAQIDSLICKIALVMVNREGVEGSNSASEGTMARTWDGGDLPGDIITRLKPYRVIRGL